MIESAQLLPQSSEDSNGSKPPIYLRLTPAALAALQTSKTAATFTLTNNAAQLQLGEHTFHGSITPEPATIELFEPAGQHVYTSRGRLAKRLILRDEPIPKRHAMRAESKTEVKSTEAKSEVSARHPLKSAKPKPKLKVDQKPDRARSEEPAVASSDVAAPKPKSAEKRSTPKVVKTLKDLRAKSAAIAAKRTSSAPVIELNDSPRPTKKPKESKDELQTLAKKFRTTYKEYAKLYATLADVAQRPSSQVEKLMTMHKELADWKARLWSSVGQNT